MKQINSSKKNNFIPIKALVFDWDGVFHSGYKSPSGESSFSEADSMGINMLRLAYYLQNLEIPKTIIISGENNKTAHFLAQREHFDAVFSKAKDKKGVLNFLKKTYAIEKTEVLFVFDDILDLSLAKECGIRFLIKRAASLPLENYIIENELADFITQNDGGNHAIREICEFIITELNLFEKTLETRIAFSSAYLEYLAKRQQIETKLFDISVDLNLLD